MAFVEPSGRLHAASFLISVDRRSAQGNVRPSLQPALTRTKENNLTEAMKCREEKENTTPAAQHRALFVTFSRPSPGCSAPLARRTVSDNQFSVFPAVPPSALRHRVQPLDSRLSIYQSPRKINKEIAPIV